DLQRDRAVAGRDFPVAGRAGAGPGVNLHAAVAGARAQRGELAVELDAAVAGVHRDVAREIARVDAAVARSQLDLAVDALDVDRPVAALRQHVARRGQRHDQLRTRRAADVDAEVAPGSLGELDVDADAVAFLRGEDLDLRHGVLVGAALFDDHLDLG